MGSPGCKTYIRSVSGRPRYLQCTEIDRAADKDLLNVLYDADHFRIALGQLSTAKHLIETVSRDYVRLLKYAPSLYQCKQLKRAALGRMATICRRLKDPLVYLEQVRQHLGRLPSIDPNTRTLLICGYPNVGKSSFLKSITRADVDVQPYAFTTKSLFVGHFDYKYLRFQAIDTPGILDHPLEEMNTIEMQSITAIAHLRSAILYFMDLSEQCGYTVSSQIQLFQSIKPLFANKLVFIVINKIDLCTPADLDPETKAQLDDLLTASNIELLQLSCATTEGITAVKNAACDRLIADRVAQKLSAGTNTSGTVSSRLDNVLTRIHVAQPLDGLVREPYIPPAIAALRKFSKEDPMRPRLARELEEENGGPGVFNVNLKTDYKLENPEWNEDRVPEIINGKNVADFIDKDIEAKLAALEEEEEKLQAAGFYDSEEELEDADVEDIAMKADVIRQKRDEIRNEAKMRKSLKNRAVIPRSKRPPKKLEQVRDEMDRLGFDAENFVTRARSRGRSLAGRNDDRDEEAEGDADPDAMDVDPSPRDALREKSRARVRSQSNRRVDGVKALGARNKAEKLAKLGQVKMNRMARQGEADRHSTASLAKHLVSSPFHFLFCETCADGFLCSWLVREVLGKRGVGKARWVGLDDERCLHDKGWSIRRTVLREREREREELGYQSPSYYSGTSPTVLSPFLYTSRFDRVDRCHQTDVGSRGKPCRYQVNINQTRRGRTILPQEIEEADQ